MVADMQALPADALPDSVPLPATAAEMVRLIGHARTMMLVREMGGREVRFPVRLAGDVFESLVEVVGATAAKVLCAHYRAEMVYVPLCAEALRRARNAQMIAVYEALLARGFSGRAAVAQIVGDTRFRPVSNRTVEKIVNGPTPSGTRHPEQGSLF